MNEPTRKAHVLPHDVELEKAVIAALMADVKAYSRTERMFTPDSFYNPVTKEIAESIKYLRGQNRPIDLLTIIDRLKTIGKLEAIGGEYALVEISNRVASTAHLEAHYAIIYDKWRRREMYKVGAELMRLSVAESEDAQAIKECETLISTLFKGNPLDGQIKTSMEVVRELEIEEDRIRKIGDGFIGIPSGLSDLDRKTNGFQAPDLIIIAARPGMGKTAFADTICNNIGIKQQRKVAFYSLEMSALQQKRRMIADIADIPLYAIKDPRKITSESAISSYTAAKEFAADGQILFIDSPLDLRQMQSSIRYVVGQLGAELVVIDYLQLIRNDGYGKNREQEVSEITRTLKLLAKELRVPIIALSQLSRAVETRGGSKRPILSDLRESGGIEQDADLVGMLYRPEYYGILEDEDGNSLAGMVEIIIAKGRDLSTDSVWVQFKGQTTSMCDLPMQGQSLDDVSLPYKDDTLINPNRKKNDGDIPF